MSPKPSNPPTRPPRRSVDWQRLVFALLGGLVLMFILAPLMSMFLGTSARAMVETATDPEVTASISRTLWLAMAATLVVGVAAVPLGYLLARGRFRGKRIIGAIIDLPVVIPHSAAGIALLSVVTRDSVLGSVADGLGLSFVNSPLGTTMAMAFVSVPYLVNAARDGFAAVPERLEDAARTLGASSSRVFFTISLPLAWRSVLSGFILMWARGMSEFGAVVVIAYQPIIAPTLIWERFGSFGLDYARPVSAVFVAVCLAVFVVLRIVAGGGRDARRQ